MPCVSEHYELWPVYSMNSGIMIVMRQKSLPAPRGGIVVFVVENRQLRAVAQAQFFQDD